MFDGWLDRRRLLRLTLLACVGLFCAAIVYVAQRAFVPSASGRGSEMLFIVFAGLGLMLGACGRILDFVRRRNRADRAQRPAGEHDSPRSF